MNGSSVIPSVLRRNAPKELIGEHNRLQPPQIIGNDRATANVILRPILEFLLLAIVLMPAQWYLSSSWDEGDIEMVWARAARGLWIAWLVHAAGLLDEALRVFLGIRLTQGLGTPTSVNNVYSKISRWAEVVAEGIAVDDFPALATLYAGGLDQGAMKRSNSGEVGAAAAEARANRLLVMRVKHVSAIAYLWSFLPWKTVRRYQRVHVKGMTLRLRQVNGILNFSFLALGKAERGHPLDRTSFSSSLPDPLDELDGFANSQECRSRSPTDTSIGDYLEEEEEEEEERHDEAPSVRILEVKQELEMRTRQERIIEEQGVAKAREFEPERQQHEAAEVATQQDDADSIRGGFDTMSEGGATRGRGLRRGLRSRRFPSPWISSGTSATSGTKHGERQNQSKEGSGRNSQSNGMPSVQGEPTRRNSFSVSVESPKPSEGRQLQPKSATHGLNGSHGGALEEGQQTPDLDEKEAQPLGSGNKEEKPAENLGNLGVVKVLGEAFMRRYNAYAEQVSATFNRVANIRLLPTLPGSWGLGKGGIPKKREPKRFEVGEILLEDVCICVDSGVWNDMLGDHVGAAFSPEFRLEVKVGPQVLRHFVETLRVSKVPRVVEAVVAYLGRVRKQTRDKCLLAASLARQVLNLRDIPKYATTASSTRHTFESTLCRRGVVGSVERFQNIHGPCRILVDLVDTRMVVKCFRAVLMGLTHRLLREHRSQGAGGGVPMVSSCMAQEYRRKG